MPLLASWIASLLSSLTAWIFGQFSARVAWRLTAVTALTAFAVAAWTAITQCSVCTNLNVPALAAVSGVGGSLVTVLSWIVPENLVACMLCILGVESLIGTYRWAKLTWGIASQS